MSFLSILSSIAGFFWHVLGYIWHLVALWLGIFIAPVHKPELLWILIPIWVSWFFSEFFQEKTGTSFGNAISNGVIPLFVGIDWTRYVLNETTSFTSIVFFKYLICFLVLIYGVSIIIFGIKTKQFIHVFGRIREITYVLLMFSPVIYGVVDMTWEYFLVVLLFFPAYYFLIEWLCKALPDPKAVSQDRVESTPEQTQQSPTSNYPPSGQQPRPQAYPQGTPGAYRPMTPGAAPERYGQAQQPQRQQQYPNTQYPQYNPNYNREHK